MYVCICHSVTDRQIREAVAQGATTLRDLCEGLKVASTCGKCASCARQLLKQSRTEPCLLPAGHLTLATPAYA